MNLHSERTPFRGPRAIASLLFLGLVTTGLTALPGQAAPPKPSSTTIDFVALGDSYTAGQGTKDAVPGCYRSELTSYPARVNEQKGLNLRHNAACSGSSTADIIGQLHAPDQPTDPDPTLGLVTLTVGGIDAGSDEIALACADGKVEGYCKDLLTITVEEEDALRGKLADAYSAISWKYPNATVAAMGYPRMFGGFYLTQAFPVALNAAIDRLNDIISNQAVASNAKFVDVREEFKGHEIGSARPWINFNSQDLGDSANFHPNETGYKSGYYQALVNDSVIPKR